MNDFPNLTKGLNQSDSTYIACLFFLVTTLEAKHEIWLLPVIRYLAIENPKLLRVFSHNLIVELITIYEDILTDPNTSPPEDQVDLLLKIAEIYISQH